MSVALAEVANRWIVAATFEDGEQQPEVRRRAEAADPSGSRGASP
jgi:hypothetical protein